MPMQYKLAISQWCGMVGINDPNLDTDPKNPPVPHLLIDLVSILLVCVSHNLDKGLHISNVGHNSLFHQRSAKVEEKPQFEIRKSKICLKLLAMGRRNLLNRFKLHDYEFFNNEIYPESLLETDSFVSYFDGHLSFHRETTQFQFMSKS